METTPGAFAVAFLMSTGSNASKLKQPLTMDNPSIPEGWDWDWDTLETFYRLWNLPTKMKMHTTPTGAFAHQFMRFWQHHPSENKFEQVPMHKHLAAWPWIVIWCLARDNQTRELEKMTAISSYHDDFAKDFPELLPTERNATVHLLFKVKHAVEQMHSMGGYQKF